MPKSMTMLPSTFEDAMDSYEKVLEIAGEICGDIVAPNAESVDHEGPQVINGRVKYASGTEKNLDALVKAGLMGISIPSPLQRAELFVLYRISWQPIW